MKKMSLNQGLCLLVEDQIESRDFFVRTLSSAFPGIKIATASNQQEAIAWINQNSAKDELQIALIDLGLPDGSGIEVIRHLKKTAPDIMSVVISVYDDDHYLFNALAAGASGYLLKSHEPALLGDILKRLEQGEPPLSPSIAHRVLAHFHTPTQNPTTDLTPRETETLTLLAQGLTVGEAAAKMGLSPQTVAGYVKIIYQKLHVSNRAEATREAVRLGLV